MDETARKLQNLTIFALIFLSLFSIVLAIAVFFTFGSVWGFDAYFKAISKKEWLDKIIFSLEYYKKAWVFWYNNSGNIGFSAKNYLVPKLFASTLIPLFTLLIILYLIRAPLMDWRPFKKEESLHGDAKWASNKDLKKAGLRSKHGMLLGKDVHDKLLVADGFQHALLFAPTGSGKGVGFVIPNLLFWNESIFCHDIKLENFEITSGYRLEKLKQKVFLWNPASPEGMSHCYNPLDWLSDKPGQVVDDVQKISNILIPKQDFWENEARSLFVGVVLYLCAVPEKLTSFGEVVRTLRSDDVVYNLAVVLDTIGKQIHPVAYMNIAAFLQKAEKERSGVISTLNSKLELWANPLIDTATATSDFDVSTFKRVPTTVYVGLTPDNLKRLEPLMQVFYQQAANILTQRMPTDEDKYGVMFMMDEFPTLGKMEIFKSGIAYFRGYKVRLFLIIQDTEQLKDIYEAAGMNSFLSNSTYRITFAANNYETAELISKLLGNKTADQVSANKPKFLDLNPASRTLHVSMTQRALLLPQEVIGLERDYQILLIESSPPIKSKKIKYYEDKMFTKRLLPPIDVPMQEPFDPRKDELKKEAEEAEKEIKDAEETMSADAPAQEDDVPALPVEEEPAEKKAVPPPPPGESFANKMMKKTGRAPKIEDGPAPEIPSDDIEYDDFDNAGKSLMEEESVLPPLPSEFDDMFDDDDSDFKEDNDLPPLPTDEFMDSDDDDFDDDIFNDVENNTSDDFSPLPTDEFSDDFDDGEALESPPSPTSEELLEEDDFDSFDEFEDAFEEEEFEEEK